MKDGIRASDLMKRPEMNYESVVKLAPADTPLPADVCEQVEIQIKYEGYIEKSLQQVEKLKRWKTKRFRIESIMMPSKGLQLKRSKS